MFMTKIMVRVIALSGLLMCQMPCIRRLRRERAGRAVETT
jgi:hypothetical protein